MNGRQTLPCIGRSLLIGLLLFAASTIANAAALRGQLVRVAPNGSRFPAAGITVTVYNQQMGRSIAVRTGPDGMYYLQIPPGYYNLEVWLSNVPAVYVIQVNEPYTDIAPIAVP
jgi:hypothetical protein